MAKVNLLPIFAALGIQDVIAEHPFHPVRRWRFDYAIIRLRIAIEIEGGIWTRGHHVQGKGYADDMEKYNEAALLGWLLVRVTPKQLDNGDAFRLVQRAIGVREREKCNG